jgi:hypothetical protein
MFEKGAKIDVILMEAIGCRLEMSAATAPLGWRLARGSFTFGRLLVMVVWRGFQSYSEPEWANGESQMVRPIQLPRGRSQKRFVKTRGAQRPNN